MVKNGKGTILFTGATASLRGSAKFGVFAAAKFAFRALAQSMAREFGPQGIHVAHIIIDGGINTPRQIQGKVCCFL
jgi:short-subunit dehydrogenase